MINIVKNWVQGLIKRCYVTQPSNDAGNYPVTQVSYNGKEATVEHLTPYGVYSNPPAGSLGVMFNVGGDEENRAAIFNTPTTRFKNLKKGEVYIGNTVTGAYAAFLENGSIHIVVPNSNLTMQIDQDNTITVDGSYTLNANGNATIQAGSNALIQAGTEVDIIAPSINLTDSMGNATLGALVLLIPLINYINNHVHSNGNAGANTGVPTTSLTSSAGTDIVKGA